VSNTVIPMRSAVIGVAMLGLLSACAMGPNYRRPEVAVPEQFRAPVDGDMTIANTAWWEQFQDPQLSELVRMALTQNRDLAVTTARVEEFFARYGAQRSALFPQVGVTAQGQRQQLSSRQYPALDANDNPPFNDYLAAAGATWEIDLWGKLRRANEAARAEMLASEEGRRGAVLTLVSAVATSYINLLNLDRQLEIARDTTRAREESKRIFELRFQGGAVSEVELYQARADYEQAMSTIPSLERQVAREENNLAILTGRNPGAIVRGGKLDDLASPPVPNGLPSELLERRPDLRQAEYNLVAANARIGVAKAAFFPSISLTGLFGSASASLSDLFTGPAQTWNYGGALTQPLFAGGFFRSQYAGAKAQHRQFVAAYEGAIQNAFREVADSLTDQQKLREQLAAQGRQVEALRGYAQLARMRYENGYTSYLEVTDAETRLFAEELNYTAARGQLFFALIGTYKALGGGWVQLASDAAPPPDAPVKPKEE